MKGERIVFQRIARQGIAVSKYSYPSIYKMGVQGNSDIYD